MPSLAVQHFYINIFLRCSFKLALNFNKQNYLLHMLACMHTRANSDLISNPIFLITNSLNTQPQYFQFLNNVLIPLYYILMADKFQYVK